MDVKRCGIFIKHYQVKKGKTCIAHVITACSNANVAIKISVNMFCLIYQKFLKSKSLPNFKGAGSNIGITPSNAKEREKKMINLFIDSTSIWQEMLLLNYK